MLNMKASTIRPLGEFYTDACTMKYIDSSCCSINSWFGIRYAQPPTGQLRWREPRDIERKNNYSTSVPINATAPGNECIQGLPTWLGTGELPTGSEDCLLLDIMVPSIPVSAGLAVMVQIHGGGKSMMCQKEINGLTRIRIHTRVFGNSGTRRVPHIPVQWFVDICFDPISSWCIRLSWRLRSH